MILAQKRRNQDAGPGTGILMISGGKCPSLKTCFHKKASRGKIEVRHQDVAALWNGDFPSKPWIIHGYYGDSMANVARNG